MKTSLVKHPSVQAQQQQFRDEIANFVIQYCYICWERWPTKQNLHMIEKYPPNQAGDPSIIYYRCSSCN